MRVLIFGASGQVGVALQQTAPPGIHIVAHDLAETDIRRPESVRAAIDSVAPDLVVNCAAFTNVDAAESDPETAHAVNALAPGTIAEAASAAHARLVHISTDYVFNGQASIPYAPNAATAPLSVYGSTKLEGEQRVLRAASNSVILRTAWVHSSGGANFVRTAVRHLMAGKTMRVVDDQIGTPTRAAHLAHAIWRLSERPDARGILHFTDSGVASWFDVAQVVLATLRAAAGLPADACVRPIPSYAYPTPARRPAYSVLDKHDSWQAIGYVPPHWHEGVRASVIGLLNA
ncbi:MAG TPA: dTDP-4-dehydrorhamnose reductase [Gemmatimonadaceae bacterium]|nr:dTDP-4-dehydrorhamnose reductase [Gemmatimonadaceae bacterium]